MASTKQHLIDARDCVRALKIDLGRIAELDGARNPEAMYVSVLDAIRSATAIANELTPLRCRLSLQLNKKANARDSKAAAKKTRKAVA